MSRSDRRHRVAVGTAVGIGATVVMVPSAPAADLTVINTADSGAGSLRDAINTANLTPATSDRILFQSGLSGTITLASNLPALSGPTELEGPGMDQLNINGADSFRILESTSDTTVSGLTLANGKADIGGAINVGGADLVVDKTRVEGGTALTGSGGIAFSVGRLTLKDSELTGNEAPLGGGLGAGYAVVAISGTTFSGNIATGNSFSYSGGGAYLNLKPGSQSTITNSTFTGNSAWMAGGLSARGAALSIESTLFSGNTGTNAVGGLTLGGGGASPYGISNSTITNNKGGAVGGGVLANGENVTIESSTITGNKVLTPLALPYRGAGVTHVTGIMKLNNSIVSGNSPDDLATVPDIPDNDPPIVASKINASFSLIGSAPYADVMDTIPGSNITSSDVKLGPLADNGGPTETLLPANDSPAVNKGSTSLADDQRGLARPVDFVGVPFSSASGADGADIGAVELQYTPPAPLPSNNFSFGKVKLNKKKGVATLQVKVPGAGKVLLLGSKTVAKSSKSAKGKSTVKLTVKAKGKAAKTLKKKGKAKVKAKVKFTPNGGKAKTKSKTVKLVNKKKKKKK